ncbi:MAG TPA: PEP-CTERM sorting domain-containing protein [Myxococcota bacterium]|nr:PEP-CTERM sorting domain-containing protein [Myxococcota bacterium]
MRSLQRTLATVLAAFFCLVVSHAAHASTFQVAPGYDLFQTDASTFFAGLGNLMGVPVGSYNFGGSIGVQSTGLTDTIIQRTGDATPGSPTVQLVMDTLQLETVAPTNFLGAGFGNYFVTLQPTSPAGGSPSTGSLTVSWDGTGLAGTFSSTLDVFFDIHFGALNGPVVYSSNLVLSQSGASWSDLPPAGAVLINGANQFLSGTPGDPTQDFLPGMFSETQPGGDQHVVMPGTPEPSTAVLLGLGVAAIAVKRRRSK